MRRNNVFSRENINTQSGARDDERNNKNPKSMNLPMMARKLRKCVYVSERRLQLA
jgi:hypothetical protein